MEREGKGEVGRGRREKMRGIIVGGMALLLVLGCNNGGNGGEDPQKVFLKSVVSLGNNFLDVFTSFGDTFGDMFSETLGFKADSSKKADVGKHFKKIQDAVQSTKDKLQKIVEDMKSENNPNAAGVETAVKTLNEKLTTIIDGAKNASDAIGITGEELIGNVATAHDTPSNAKGVAGTGIEKLIEGIKGIVEVVLKDKGSPDAGDNNKAETGTARSNDGAGKLFDGTTGPAAANAKKDAADAAKAVGAVTGADILKAIIEANGDAAKLAKNSAVISGSGASAAPKDSVMAGGYSIKSNG